ncbi:hypothetical protein LDG_6972 [Legionella drancourtii LLAP12]|uniref:Uncharacterized protein n=1 Tax=Legionella drancourtii LLAP12 TaxID=658187 RepID=G9ENZ2_9GAMM|nr:hypothetical protein LDG_6972 [Legionella drancourtii LLAP12]
MDRFEKILHLLNYKEKIPSYHRGNLILAIMDFSSLNKDSELEVACQNEIERIRAKNLSMSD